MFEDRTYEKVLEETLSKAPEGIDIREGSIFYDAVAGICYKIAEYYFDLGHVIDLTFLTTAQGEYLDQKGLELGLERNSATYAVYELVFDGNVTPKAGDRFFTDGKHFEVIVEDGHYRLKAKTAGSEFNDIPKGERAVPLDSNLKVATFGALVEPGADKESDDDYRRRIREKLAGPAENGNRQHYKSWCEQIAGVGRARIIPLWDGPNTVKGVILGTDGKPAGETVVERVQEYIDPGSTGLGNGVANIGAFFIAVSAEPLTVNVGFKVSLFGGYTLDDVREQATAAIESYMKEIMLETPETENMVVRIAHIGSLLLGLKPVMDYADLELNGEEANILIGSEQACVLGEVVVDEIV